MHPRTLAVAVLKEDEDEEEEDEDEPSEINKSVCEWLCGSSKQADPDDVPFYQEMAMQFVNHPLLIIAGLFILIFATFFLAVRQDWEITTAMYVIMQIITTIGWGDVTVTHEVAQIVMSFVILALLIVIAKILSLFLDVIFSRQDRAARKGMRYLESSLRHDDDFHRDYKRSKMWEKINKFVVSLLTFLFFIAVGTIFYSIVEYCDCSYGVTAIEGCSRGPDRTDMELCISTGGNVMTWINAYYFSVVSLTTVGFGDFSPSSYEGRLFAIPWAFFGVLSCGYFITSTSELLSADSSDPAIVEISEIDEKLFKDMDSDNNGFLTKGEFRMWVLMQSGLVDKDLIDAIDSRYDEIDECTPGEQQVTWEDVQMFAELRAKKEEEKRLAQTMEYQALDLIEEHQQHCCG